MKIEIDKEIIAETTLCQNDSVCLAGDVSPCCHVEKKGKNIICKSEPDNGSGTYCNYRIKFNESNIVCGCPVRKEIYRKHQL